MKPSKNQINFLSKRIIAFCISITIIIIGLLKLLTTNNAIVSIDFTGGIEAQIEFQEKIEIEKIKNKLTDNSILKDLSIIQFGKDSEVLMKSKFSGTNNEFQEILSKSFKDKPFKINRIDLIGPKVGKELQSDAFYAVVLALVLILLYIGFRFDFYYSIGSIAALLHDVLAVLSILLLFNYEISLHVIAALLTIVGYSLNDTIVVFDRIRENILLYKKKNPLFDIINFSLNKTLSRTIITSLTTLLVLLSLYFLGGDSIKLFSFSLIVGVLVGTYSSLFVASPVLYFFESKQSEKQKEE